jgi:hypothetical protein
VIELRKLIPKHLKTPAERFGVFLSSDSPGSTLTGIIEARSTLIAKRTKVLQVVRCEPKRQFVCERLIIYIWVLFENFKI